MQPRHFRDLIVRAVEQDNDGLLDSLAQHLHECAEAKGILRAKGYGMQGMGIVAMVRLVPADQPWLQGERAE